MRVRASRRARSLGRRPLAFRLAPAIFFVVGALLYACIPTLGHGGNLALFILSYLIILSMYGGGFATIPAYFRDIFGPAHVGYFAAPVTTMVPRMYG